MSFWKPNWSKTKLRSEPTQVQDAKEWLLPTRCLVTGTSGADKQVTVPDQVLTRCTDVAECLPPPQTSISMSEMKGLVA